MATIKKMFDEEAEKTFFIIYGIRVSYPHLFQKGAYEGAVNPRGFGVTALLDKDHHTDAISVLSKEIDHLIKTELKVKNLSAERRCFKDGDASDKEEYENSMTLKASESTRPLVMAKGSVSEVLEADNQIYAGCYANVKISLWAQNNTWGKRINANLHTIQFEDDGEPFGNTLTEDQHISGFDSESAAGSEDVAGFEDEFPTT